MFQKKKDVVEEYKVLKRKKNSEEALTILKKLVSQVKPILTKRNWSVRYLCEFFPKNPNLLGTNVNQGYKINLRLRPHYDDNVFLEYNDILGTLLHELAHIVRGPHDEIFYKLLSELREETEMLMASGYSGEGFYSNGQRLSSSTSVPRYRSNQIAAEAAEKRKQIDKIMLPQGGIRLGGGGKGKLLSPVQMAAIAAERRLRDQVWCGGSITIEDDDDEKEEEKKEEEKQEEEKQKKKKSIQKEDGTFTTATTKTTTTTTTTTTPMTMAMKRKPFDQPESSSSSKRMKEPELFIDLTDNNNNNNNNDVNDVKKEESHDKKEKEGWSCSTCTFFNGSIVLVCEICLTERPIQQQQQLIKDDDNNNDDDDTWLCPQCTLKNEKKWSVCNACQYLYLR